MKRLITLVIALTLMMSLNAFALDKGLTFTHPEIGEPMTIAFNSHMPYFKIYGFTYYMVVDPAVPHHGMHVNDINLINDNMSTIDESLNLLFDYAEGKTEEEAPVALTYPGVMEEYAAQLDTLPREKKVQAIKLLNGFEGKKGYKDLQKLPGFEGIDAEALENTYSEFKVSVDGRQYPYRVLQFHIEETDFDEYYFERFGYVKVQDEWLLARVAKEYGGEYEGREIYMHGMAGFEPNAVYDISYELLRDMEWGAKFDDVLKQQEGQKDGNAVKVKDIDLFGIPTLASFDFSNGKLSSIQYDFTSRQAYFSAFISLYMRYADPTTISQNGDMTWSFNDMIIRLHYDDKQPEVLVEAL